VALHYANLRPLWGSDNQRKNARIPEGLKSIPSSVASLKRAVARIARNGRHRMP
jgi:hypothetical protein